MFSLLYWDAVRVLLGQTPMGEGELPQDLFKEWAAADVQDPMLSRVCLALAAVLGMIFIAAYLVKRFSRLGNHHQSRGSLKVLESLPMGGKRMVQVIKVYDRVLVVGVTGERIELLTELPDEEASPASPAETREKRKFGEIFPLSLRKGKAVSAEAKGN